MECHEDFEHCLKGSLVFCSNLFFEADHFVVDNPVLFCGACNDFLGWLVVMIHRDLSLSSLDGP